MKNKMKKKKTSYVHAVSEFYNNEDGDIAVMCAFLLPVLLLIMIYFENQMQAQYVYNQTQTVFDMATRAGTMTGNAVKDKKTGVKFCTIPYNESDKGHSGYHVTRKMIEENLNTLPKYVRDQIRSKLNSGQVGGLNDPDLRAGGYVTIKMTFKYKPTTPLFGKEYKFVVQSSAKCEVAD